MNQNSKNFWISILIIVSFCLGTFVYMLITLSEGNVKGWFDTRKNTIERVLFGEEEDEACIEIYQPVCGRVNIQCITTPCDPILQTFVNSCFAKQAKAFDLLDGECQE